MIRIIALSALILGALGAGSVAIADDSPAATTQLDQDAIYHILCGGTTHDATLSSHLWELAGSLASAKWTPPKVTIRVVVSSTSG